MNSRPLRVTYLLEDAALSGGVRVVLAHADAMIARGHHVRVVSKTPLAAWRNTLAVWETVDSFENADYGNDDFVIATFWTTVADAFRLAGSRALHFCQGYEGAFTAYREIAPRIEEAYRLEIPKLVVSRHLIDTCRALGVTAHYVGQFVDETFFEPTPRARSRHRPRVLLVGASEIDFKGIDVGYEAVRLARARGLEFDLVRVSPWKPAAGEPAGEAAEFHSGLSTAEMKRLMSSCDIFLGPSRRDEGFGLPAAEAMAIGLPAVLARIPSFSSFGELDDYALFFDEDSAEQAAAQLEQLLLDPSIEKRLIERGREVVRQFHPANAVVLLEGTFLALRSAQVEETEHVAPGSS